MDLREKLLTYIGNVENKKIEALYTILEKEIQNQDQTLTDEQLAELEKAREDYFSGKTKTHTAEESLAYIKGEILTK
ncbi:MAG: hypothetical protein INR69_19105 [Mucilaginibacter polytrichastri]|nr:hypothetical protein [Mucilaginibacter polytrichastri]